MLQQLSRNYCETVFVVLVPNMDCMFSSNVMKIWIFMNTRLLKMDDSSPLPPTAKISLVWVPPSCASYIQRLYWGPANACVQPITSQSRLPIMTTFSGKHHCGRKPLWEKNILENLFDMYSSCCESLWYHFNLFHKSKTHKHNMGSN